MSNLFSLPAVQPPETHIQNDKMISWKINFFKIIFSQNINSQNNNFSYFLKKFFFIKRKRKHSKEKCSTNKKSTYQNRLSVSFKILYGDEETLLYKRVSALFVIISCSLFLTETFWSQTTHFYEKYLFFFFQNQWNITKTRAPFCPLLFNKTQRGKNTEKHSLWGENSRSWKYFTTISTKSKT